MKIKVCGMREAQNIEDVMALDIDMIGFIFYPKSSRYVSEISSHAGIIPDMASIDIKRHKAENAARKIKKVGVFVDDMPQNIVTRVYNYELDYIQLHGSETVTYIDNLRRTLVPDIAPDIKIIKAISIREADDVKRWRRYEGHIDMLLFDTKCDTAGGSGKKFEWELLKQYDGNIPFILSGGISPDDAEEVRAFRHPQCIGIDINSCFETGPALKDIPLLRTFITAVRA